MQHPSECGVAGSMQLIVTSPGGFLAFVKTAQSSCSSFHYFSAVLHQRKRRTTKFWRSAVCKLLSYWVLLLQVGCGSPLRHFGCVEIFLPCSNACCFCSLFSKKKILKRRKDKQIYLVNINIKYVHKHTPYTWKYIDTHVCIHTQTQMYRHIYTHTW